MHRGQKYQAINVKTLEDLFKKSFVKQWKYWKHYLGEQKFELENENTGSKKKWVNKQLNTLKK